MHSPEKYYHFLTEQYLQRIARHSLRFYVKDVTSVRANHKFFSLRRGIKFAKSTNAAAHFLQNQNFRLHLLSHEATPAASIFLRYEHISQIHALYEFITATPFVRKAFHTRVTYLMATVLTNIVHQPYCTLAKG